MVRRHIVAILVAAGAVAFAGIVALAARAGTAAGARENELAAANRAATALFEAEQAASAAADKRKVQQRVDAVARVWAAYDALPAEKRQKAFLQVALDEARTHERDLPQPHLGQIEASNLVQFRKRAAPLISPGTRAAGDRMQVLIPSADSVGCPIVAAAWARDAADDMRTMGFEALQCAAYTYKSKLTGENVTEPTKEWKL